MYDIVNEDRIDQELARIFRGVSKDARIARWLKKRGAAFLKSRVSDVIEVHPTSPGARNFPQWAVAKMAKNEPVFMFALGHGSQDQLSHVKDLFEALIPSQRADGAGGWWPAVDAWSIEGTHVHATAVCTLALQAAL